MNHREQLDSAEQLLEKYNDQFLQIRDLVIDQQVSNYPIFVLQKPSVQILGTKILDENQNPDRWNVYITHLEDLYNKKIIKEERLDEFKFNYKEKSDQFCALMIMDENHMEFAFYPIKYTDL